MMEIATKLLVCAGTLMLIAGAFFGFLGQWLYAALIWAGAMGCLAAEMNVKNQNRSYKESTIANTIRFGHTFMKTVSLN